MHSPGGCGDIGIAFAAQVVSRAGAGSWALGFSAAICIFIFALALIKGTRDFPLIDWIVLVGALIAIAIWYFTKDPTWSVILLVIIDTVAFIPTFRKAWQQSWRRAASR
jgi:hypothetical protein